MNYKHIHGEGCHVHKTNIHKTGFQAFISIPWCCVVSIFIIGLSLFSSVIPLSGVKVFDEFFHHYLILPTVLLHLFGIYWYITRDHHKTAKKNLLYVGLSMLFVLSMLFHFSGLHEKLFNTVESHRIG